MAPIASAALYTIPKDRSTDTVQQVINQGIPDALQQATCGYPKDMKDSESITDVNGVPLKPHQWPKDPNDPEEPDKDKLYPDTAVGFVFASGGYAEICHELRGNALPCNFPDKCEELCNYTNESPEYLYGIWRIATCRRTYTETIVTGYDDDGNPIEEEQERVEVKPSEELDEHCNSCPDGWEIGGIQPGEFDVNGDEYDGEVDDGYKEVGTKYRMHGRSGRNVD